MEAKYCKFILIEGNNIHSIYSWRRHPASYACLANLIMRLEGDKAKLYFIS